MSESFAVWFKENQNSPMLQEEFYVCDIENQLDGSPALTYMQWARTRWQELQTYDHSGSLLP